MPRALYSTTLAAAVRTHFGLTQTELSRYLGVSRPQLAHAEAGQRRLPPLLNLRLVRLARLLPPPEGEGPPRPAPLSWVPPVVPTELLGPAPAVPGPLAAAPLRKRQRQCRRSLVVLRRDWHALVGRAGRYELRRWTGQVLAALLVPHPADFTAAYPAEQARVRGWLAELAAAEPPPPALRPDTRTALALLLVRVAALEAELLTLEALLAGLV